MSQRPVFRDRREAGRRLAAVLSRHGRPDTVVLALPRGGVPVAFEVARALGSPLDLLLVRKIGAPGHPEFGVGAVVEGPEPEVVLNPGRGSTRLPPGFLEDAVARETAEIARRRRTYLAGRPPVPVAGRNVVVVDDGIATGGTMAAAVAGLRRAGAARVAVAVPVASPDALAHIEPLVDEVICLDAPEDFVAVGLAYDHFDQTSDEEVIACLAAARGEYGETGMDSPGGPPPVEH